MKQSKLQVSLSNQMLDMAAECFNAATLEAMARMRLSRKQAARVDRLAAKANEGLLTPKERAEYASYIKTSETLGVLQLRARVRLGLPVPAE